MEKQQQGGGEMKDYQLAAMEAVRRQARESLAREERGSTAPGLLETLTRQLARRPVTLNFHPDRLTKNGKTVLENLLEQGVYRCQYETGTTNGGTGAYVGGNRYTWEQELFHGAYPPQALDRPKYGAVNLLRDLDGACVRFGSCYLELNSDAGERATFSYGDSSTGPTALCTRDTFSVVVMELMKDLDRGKLLNRQVTGLAEGLRLLSGREAPVLGRNLDDCVEAHIHGELSLERDAKGLYLDESYRDTEISRQAGALCRRYGLELGWIPRRRIFPDQIPQDFRGPKIPALAREIQTRFEGKRDGVDAFLLGQASRDSMKHPENWAWLGSEKEVFQAMKQLWHAIGCFG